MLSPLEISIQNVCDGLIEPGDKYPTADIIGIDLSPTQPDWCVTIHEDMQPPVTDRFRVPPNVKFEVDDCEEPWNFEWPFDFVHIRYMAGSIKDWPKFVQQSYKGTAPGGWVEIMDLGSPYYSEDGSLTEDAPVYGWMTELLNASRQFGRDPCPSPELAGYL